MVEKTQRHQTLRANQNDATPREVPHQKGFFSCYGDGAHSPSALTQNHHGLNGINDKLWCSILSTGIVSFQKFFDNLIRLLRTEDW